MHLKNNLCALLLVVFWMAIASSSNAQSSKIEKIDNLKQLLLEEASDTVSAQRLKLIGSHYYGFRLDSAELYFEKALAMYQQMEYHRQVMGAQIALAKINFAQEKLQDGFSRYKAVLEMATKLENEKYQVEGNIGMAKYYSRIKDYEQALVCNERALAIGKNKLAPNKVVEIGITTGYTYIKLDNVKKALEVTLSLVPYAERGELSPLRKQEIYIKLADIYCKLENSAKTVEYSQIAYDINVANADRNRQLVSLLFKGFGYRMTDDLSNIKKTFHHALALMDSLNQTTHRPIALKELGKAYLKEKKYDKASGYYKELLTIAQASGRDNYVAQAYGGLGKISFEQNKLTTARQQFAKAKEKANALKEIDKVTLMQLYELMYVVDTLEQIYTQETFDNYRNYITLLDSITAKKRRTQIDSLEIAFETERKENKIALLTSENQVQKLEVAQQRNLSFGLIIGSLLLLALLGVLYYQYQLKKRAATTFRVQKEAIEQKNEENKLLVQEIHHRVKNNMQIIQGLLNAKAYSNPENEDLQFAVKDCNNQINSMALIHKDLYGSNNFILVNTSTYFPNLIEHIKTAYPDATGRIQIQSQIKSMDIPMDVAVPLGLIVNELSTNAIKYAFPAEQQDCQVAIEFQNNPQENEYVLQVRDNGKGFKNVSEVDDLPSFGLRMVNGLAEQLGGSLKISNGVGTQFRVAFSR